MKAIVYTEYGTPDVLRLVEREKPQPKAGQVLVKVHAASVNTADWYYLTGSPFMLRFDAGISKPKHHILGFDIAGRIEAVGSGITLFKVGDEVYGEIAGVGDGGFAEYVAVPEARLSPKPSRLTFEEAAAVPMAAVTALQGLRDYGKVQAGQKVLIHGASGGVGTFALQIAKALGAEVTAVVSTAKVQMALQLGADHVIDYKREDFSRTGQRYDVIVATNGSRSLLDYKRALAPRGVFVNAGGSMRQIFASLLLGPLLSIGSGVKMGGFMAKASAADLAFITTLIDDGKIVPLIDRCYPLAETAEAMRYLGTGHAAGKVVVAMN